MKTENRNKRVVFTMGGKGGVGKTGLMVALAEWFEAHEIPFTLLDLDTENKTRGSLKHFFNGSVTKVNIHTPAGLDSFIDHLESGASIILADMGAGSGQVASDWFDSMYEDVSVTGARFTAVGVITPDPASVESVLAWANRLQDRVQYVVVQNATSPQSTFSYWGFGRTGNSVSGVSDTKCGSDGISSGGVGESRTAARSTPGAGCHAADFGG